MAQASLSFLPWLQVDTTSPAPNTKTHANFRKKGTRELVLGLIGPELIKSEWVGEEECVNVWGEGGGFPKVLISWLRKDNESPNTSQTNWKLRLFLRILLPFLLRDKQRNGLNYPDRLARAQCPPPKARPGESKAIASEPSDGGTEQVTWPVTPESGLFFGLFVSISHDSIWLFRLRNAPSLCRTSRQGSLAASLKSRQEFMGPSKGPSGSSENYSKLQRARWC